jgi:hypothetical protein
MSKTKMLIGLAAAVCALAVTAVPAMGHAFVGSKTGLLSGKGFEEIEKVEKGSGEFREFNPERMQEWHFGIFDILCYSESSKGELLETSTNTLTLHMKFSNCGWYPKPKVDLHTGASFSKEGITVKFHANGFVETLENGEEIEYKGEILPGAAFVKVNGKICKIEILAQTIPVKAINHPEEEFSSVLYSNFTVPVAKPTKVFPTGEQERILLTNAWKAIKYHFGGEESQCTNPEGFEKQSGEEGGAAGGNYKGQTYVKLGGGNLKYE